MDGQDLDTRVAGQRSVAHSVETTPPVPAVVLGEVIGRGGFATVYRGRQTTLDRDVAVKIDSRPLSDERNRRRFLREATAASRIGGHPHVVSLYDAGTTPDDLPYLVMEWCPHGSLADLLGREGSLGAADARDMGLALCSALAAAHEAGVLHRDIKPANVLIDAYGTPRLSDFGLAALPSPGQDLSVTLEALTPAYASPEAFSSADPTPASDVWSLGATLHAMLTPRSPRRTEDGRPASIGFVMEHLADPLPDPGVPGSEELMAVIRRATAYDPADRFADGREMYDALAAARVPETSHRRVVGGPEASILALPPLPPPPARPAPPRRTSRRSRLALGAVGLAVGAAAGVGLGFALDEGLASTGPAARSTGSSSSADGTATEPVPDLGACWGGITTVGGQPSTAGSLPCDQPHAWETYASGTLATAEAPYPADVAADPTVVATCTKAALGAYLGGASTSGFELDVLPPSTLDWQAGSRSFSCVASPAGGETTGSLRG